MIFIPILPINIVIFTNRESLISFDRFHETEKYLNCSFYVSKDFTLYKHYVYVFLIKNFSDRD